MLLIYCRKVLHNGRKGVYPRTVVWALAWNQYFFLLPFSSILFTWKCVKRLAIVFKRRSLNSTLLLLLWIMLGWFPITPAYATYKVWSYWSGIRLLVFHPQPSCDIEQGLALWLWLSRVIMQQKDPASDWTFALWVYDLQQAVMVFNASDSSSISEYLQHSIRRRTFLNCGCFAA